jgi:hypothetical protein
MKNLTTVARKMGQLIAAMAKNNKKPNFSLEYEALLN